MTGPLYRLGRFCSRRWPFVLVAWALIFGGLAVWAGSAGQEVNDNLTLPGTDSQNATDLLDDKFPEQANGTNPVVLKAPEGKKLKQDPYAMAVNVKPSATELTEEDANRIIDAADPARDAGLDVAVGGYVGQKVSKADTE